MKCKICGNELGVFNGNSIKCSKCGSIIEMCEECSGEGEAVSDFGVETCQVCNGNGCHIAKKHNDITKKNLSIYFYDENDVKIGDVIVTNMHKAWPEIKKFYSDSSNENHKVEVYSTDGVLLNDIRGHKTKNNRLWMVDSLKKKKNKKSLEVL